jgi:diaminopimelate epimerase
MSDIIFYKFHGAGNDFILIDDRNNSFPVSSELIEQMCDRHFGVGADGLILLHDRNNWDFEMVYFNRDGNQSTMCGNGGRCIIALADFLSLCGPEVKFIAIDGEHHGVIKERSGYVWQVRLKMSDVTDIKQEEEQILVDTGSPHLVRFTEGLEDYPLVDRGRQIRYSDRFRKEGINVDFVEERNNSLAVRTYERGVEDETLSCGTGATASCLAYAIRKNMSSGKVDIIAPGGKLSVSFKKEENTFRDIWLEGPAQLVFSGTYLFDNKRIKRL